LCTMIFDREPLEKAPLQDTYVIDGEIQAPIALRTLKSGEIMWFYPKNHYHALLQGLKDGSITITDTPLEIRHDDRWTGLGGAIIVAEAKGFKPKKVNCQGILDSSNTRVTLGSSKCWSDWVKTRDLPLYPLKATWDLYIPNAEKDYAKRVSASLQNRIDVIEGAELPRLRIERVEWLLERQNSASQYHDLACAEAGVDASYKSDAHYKHCRRIYSEYLFAISMVKQIEDRIQEAVHRAASYKQSLKEIEAIGAENEHK
jgi:hypothetical protein